MAITRGLPYVQALGGLKDGLGGDKVVGILGSEALVNNAIQAGSVTLSSSVAWAVFGKPFTNIPVVVASYSDYGTAASITGSFKYSYR